MSIIGFIWDVYVFCCVVFTTLVIVGLYLKRLEDKSSGDSTASNNNIRLVHVEKVDGVYLMYDAENNKFICQGTSLSELWASAKMRFPNFELVVAKE